MEYALIMAVNVKQAISYKTAQNTAIQLKTVLLEDLAIGMETVSVLHLITRLTAL
jgi:hypothetical protein